MAALTTRDPTPFLTKLRAVNPGAAIFTITEPQRLAIMDIPPPLTSLYKEDNRKLTASDLQLLALWNVSVIGWLSLK